MRQLWSLFVLCAGPGIVTAIGSAPAPGVSSDSALPLVEVTEAGDSAWLARLGFWHRRASGRAILALTGEELGPPRDMIERFKAIDGVDVIIGRHGRELRFHEDSEQECEPALFVNGSRAQRRGSEWGSMWFLDLFRPYEIDGIELYYGVDAPVGHPDECGAFIVWSKWKAGKDEVDFSGVLYGKVVDTNGRPVRECRVTLEPGSQSDLTDAQGQVTFVRVVPGLVNVRAGVGDAGLLDQIEVRASGRTTVEIIRDGCVS